MNFEFWLDRRSLFSLWPSSSYSDCDWACLIGSWNDCSPGCQYCGCFPCECWLVQVRCAPLPNWQPSTSSSRRRVMYKWLPGLWCPGPCLATDLSRPCPPRTQEWQQEVSPLDRRQSWHNMKHAFRHRGHGWRPRLSLGRCLGWRRPGWSRRMFALSEPQPRPLWRH